VEKSTLILHLIQRLGAGRRTLIFPTRFGNLVVVCGLYSEREFILPQGTNCQNLDELLSKSRVREAHREEQGETRFLRDIPPRAARKFLTRASNEMRRRDRREFVSQGAVRVWRDKNHNSYSMRFKSVHVRFVRNRPPAWWWEWATYDGRAWIVRHGYATTYMPVSGTINTMQFPCSLQRKQGATQALQGWHRPAAVEMVVRFRRWTKQ